MNLRFFNLAKKMCYFSDHPDHKHGSLLVRKNKVISFGFNKLKTHPKSKSWTRSCHAELSAILNSGLQDLSGYELYVVRVKKDGSYGSSKPCVFCRKLIQSVGIQKVHYSTDTYFESEDVA